MYFGGVEGGTTASRAVILNIHGELIGFSSGLHSNHWIIGMEEAAVRIGELIIFALKDANLDKSTELESLGLSLSGMDTVENEEQMIETLRSKFPGLARRYFACNDTIGALLTVTDEGGIALISGTGSNCKLIRQDMTFVHTGGLGYLLGDEGSAYSIAYRAIKAFVNADQELSFPEHPFDRCSQAVRDHFDVKDAIDLLPFFYNSFDKSHIATLCKTLSNLAHSGDKFSQKLFFDAGYQLGRHLAAVIRRVEDDFIHSRKNGISVACAGSVFASWDLLAPGILSGIRPIYSVDRRSFRLIFIRLNDTAAIGGAILAAQLEANIKLPRISCNVKNQVLARLEVTSDGEIIEWS